MSEYGQRSEMEDVSMVGTLAAQAEMIWPLERPLLERLGVSGARRVLDLCCGTGEIAGRVAGTWPDVEVVGLDLYPGHLEVARARHPAAAHGNLTWHEGDAHATGLEPASFDVVLLRHVLHALPGRRQVLDEARRLLRPGGLLYVLAEDYQGLVFDAAGEDATTLFLDARPALLAAGTDLFHGRAAFRELVEAGFEAVGCEPLVVDTQNAPRPVFAGMLKHWRDGYATLIARHLGRPVREIARRFDGLIAAVEDPERYACWLSLAAWGRTPKG